MTVNSCLIASMKRIFEEKGGEALNKARSAMLLSSKYGGNLSPALRHFSKVTLNNALPVFPALVSISCEAVGGDAKTAVPFGEAIVLIAGAADLHDDIIDQSLSKGPKKTVFGKFGTGETILAGDTLLVQGLTLLHEATATVTKDQGDTISRLTAEAIYELCIAESVEAKLKKIGIDVKPKAYHEVIKLKAVFPELTMKIGAILGNGDQKSVETLGECGRIFGIITTVADEFSDLLNPDEFTNRLKNECPPLPLIYALQNPKTKNTLSVLVGADLSNQQTHQSIAETVLNSPEVKKNIKVWKETVQNELIKIPSIIKRKNREEIETILLAPLEFLDNISSS